MIVSMWALLIASSIAVHLVFWKQNVHAKSTQAVHPRQCFQAVHPRQCMRKAPKIIDYFGLKI